MNFFLVFGIAFALAMDAFAVSVGVSLSLEGMTKRQTFRLAIYFGFFQFMMPVVGWLAGNSLLKYIQVVDHWIAFGLLLFVGVKMIYESFKRGKKTKEGNVNVDPTKGLSLLTLSVATSIDALAAGLSLAALQESILYPAVVIGLVAFLMTVLGTRLGPPLGQRIGKKAELAGGLILILIGIKILAEHLS